MKDDDEDNDEKYFHVQVIFHNLNNYDSHYIIRNFSRRLVPLSEDKNEEDLYKDVSIIASSTEKFIGFDIYYLRIIDSYQFLSASLDTLVKNLRKVGADKLVHTSQHLESNNYIYEKCFHMNILQIYQNFGTRVYRQSNVYLVYWTMKEFRKMKIYALKMFEKIQVPNVWGLS